MKRTTKSRPDAVTAAPAAAPTAGPTAGSPTTGAPGSLLPPALLLLPLEQLHLPPPQLEMLRGHHQGG